MTSELQQEERWKRWRQEYRETIEGERHLEEHGLQLEEYRLL